MYKTRFHLSAILLSCFVGVGLSAPPPASAQSAPKIGVKQGEMYPDFLLPTLDGKLERLSDYRGKKILLFHFASW